VRTAVGLAFANLDTQLGNIVADTDELQTDWADGGRLDLLLDGALGYVDCLPATWVTVPTAAQNRAEMDSNSTKLAAITEARLAELDQANLPADVDALKADLPNRPTKGVIFTLVFMMVDSSDHVTPKTGLTVTATISKDGAAFAAATNSVSEISGGWYKVTWTATEITPILWPGIWRPVERTRLVSQHQRKQHDPVDGTTAIPVDRRDARVDGRTAGYGDRRDFSHHAPSVDC